MAVTRPEGSQISSVHCFDANPQGGDGVLNEYEKLRQERIRANLEHFQKLGINSLTLELSSVANAGSLKRSSPTDLSRRKISPKSKPTQPYASPDQPRRRSSRLQNGTPVVYEVKALKRSSEEEEDDEEYRVPKRRRVLKGVRRVRHGPSGPEFYTEEHEKLLGTTEKTWELCVDGCGADGRRIYDSINGKTCHQCRQKTLGYRTFCSCCQMLQGQFCGDCLYMRYGEHVLEAIENPDWVCPVCRGICNCSFCRTDRGWAPTGNMYRKVVKMGYRSVAHYLIQTNRAPSSRYAAKRSLDFKVVADGGDKSETKDEKVEIDDKSESWEGKFEIEDKSDSQDPKAEIEDKSETEVEKVETEDKSESEDAKIEIDGVDKSEAEVMVKTEGDTGIPNVKECVVKSMIVRKAVKKEVRVSVQDCIARRLRSRKAST